jgi:hypothetical protein
MLDLARLTEQHDYYLDLLPHLADWGYNLLHLHFADDHGCALRFPSRPELATKHAFTPDEMRAFCDAARDHGLEVVPEVECWGHTGFITRLKRYRHLREVAEGPGRFSGMCVFEPEAQAILSDILRDTVEIFRPRLVHAGLDEVNFGEHPTSQKRLARTPRNVLFAEHVNWCYKTITRLGARMGMWGDHLLPGHDSEGVTADRTPRRTIIFDWHYNHDYEPSSMDFFIDLGFEVFGCPAIQRYRNRVISSWENIVNLQRFSGHALDRRRKRRGKGVVSGMVVTAWCPYRYVPGTIEYPLALAGRLFSSADLVPADFAADFAAGFWGLRGSRAQAVGAAVEELYLAAPVVEEYDRIVWGRTRRASDTFCRADRARCRELLGLVTEVERTLSEAVDVAKRNADRLRDLAVSARFLRTLYKFGAGGRKGRPAWKGLRRSMQAAWRRTRYSDTPDYSGKCARRPIARADYDAVMRHLNRLASE